MKKLFYSILLSFSVLLSGCFDSVQELTINQGGMGEITAKLDMSKAMEMFLQMGGNEKDKEKIKMDTVIAFKDILDSAKNLSGDEKELLKEGTMIVVMNSETGKLMITNKFPFQSVNDIDRLMKAMDKVSQTSEIDKAVSKAMGEAPGNPSGEEDSDDPFKNLPEDYYDFRCTEGKISRKLNKEKYAKLGEDTGLSKLKETSGMGLPLTSSFIINLPRPVKNFTGKNVKLSDDKKKITVENTLDDLFDDPSTFEYEIEY
jgi:hypothetical protein